MVIDNVHMVPDLLNCACVNSTWSLIALKKLYKGSLHDMQSRTPDIGSLNCLFVASRERFGRNMSFVKLLLLPPEKPGVDDVQFENNRLYCIEKCRAMRHHQSAELLLRPQGEGLASITIPFEIDGQDWSLISDLLLPRTVGFLAIDCRYVRLLMDRPIPLHGPIGLNDKFSNLKALTIYESEDTRDIDELCNLIDSCDLRFFHLEEISNSRGPPHEDLVELLWCLRQQRNLEALALSILEFLWSRLKTLHLGVADRHWLEQIPKFSKLQVLALQKFVPGTSIISRNFIKEIAKCRHLRAIDVDFHERDYVVELLDIARSCPLLQKFTLRYLGSGGEPELTEELCIGLLHSLPQLDARFLDLARRCPRLTVLSLPKARLRLSFTMLTKACPFWQLENMQFSQISSEYPRRLMQEDKIRAIATEWRRTFPKLQGTPCPEDFWSLYLQENDLYDGSGHRPNLIADEEMSPSEPGLDFGDAEGDSFLSRLELWKVLGYKKDRAIHDKIQNMWQKNLEIETVGWPVVPFVAFSDPDKHSTTARCRYWKQGV
ncbi:hypothetical protein F5884DRAFT_846048 [Xylogone sp. PMI_703]|nr:hypothetical protein F5884DRAFT_846048 [Xylogone sp. PMI_703]